MLSGLPIGCFCAPASSRWSGCVVLVVPAVGGSSGAVLRSLGCSVLAVEQASLCGGFIGALVQAPDRVRWALLSLPRPVSAGSLGVAACLPWF